MVVATTTYKGAFPDYWEILDNRFPKVIDVFDECMADALKALSEDGIRAYLERLP